MGYSERRATWLLSGFWLTFLATRLLAAMVQHAWAPRPAWADSWATINAGVIIVLALLAGVLLGHLSGAGSRGKPGLGLLALGACLGPIFPTLVGVVFDPTLTPPNHRGTAYGLMFAVGSLGSVLLPPLIGAAVRRRSVQNALRIPMLLALVMAAAALLLML